MYDFAEIRSANDQFWQALREALLKQGITQAPLSLTQPHDLPKFWSHDALLLGQTCGYPFQFGLCGKARYVATPHYKTRFSSGVKHKSLIICHRDSPTEKLADARGKVCAINMSDSNTGMNLLRLEIAKLGARAPFFSRVYETLAHRKSMHAVANGEADIASIDCVTFALVEKIDPSLVETLKIIGETESSPNLPFITSQQTDEDTLHALRAALHHVTTDPQNSAFLDPLMISGIEILHDDAYARVRDIENQAIARGYPVLA